MDYSEETLPQKNKKTEAQDLVIAAKFSPSGGYIGGITVREYFAAMAMQGCIQGDAIINKNHETSSPRQLAFSAVAMADALIAELNK